MATFGTFTSGQTLTAAELNTAGEWQSYTPTWTQSATITKTVNWARYTKLNKLVIGSIKMTATSAGTANNKMLVGLPVNASANNFMMGTMGFFDDSATTEGKYIYAGISVLYESSTTMAFSVAPLEDEFLRSSFDNKRFGQDWMRSSTAGVTGPTIASGDIIYIQFMYEAA